MKMRISMTTRKELTEALRAQYRSATFGDRTKILDEFGGCQGSCLQGLSRIRKHYLRRM
jgi:hypothetical protein